MDARDGTDGAEDQEVPAGERGGWEGSEVSTEEVEWLRSTRRIPLQVGCRLPTGEISPKPQANERVVFLSHFERGFALPVSTFFSLFLSTFHLQTHHLPANAIGSLSCFIYACEDYLGICPIVLLWAKYFSFRAQVVL